MKLALSLIATLAFATPALSQDAAISGIDSIEFDFGIGAIAKPKYPGADDHEVSPWATLRNLRIGTYGGRDSADGFSILPNFDIMGPRDEDDDDALEGMDDISRAYEAGVKLAYTRDGLSTYGTVRKGFGGHHGVVGELGVKYDFATSDKWSFQAGVEAGYGDSKLNETYFGVSAKEAANTGYSEYKPGGGFNTAAAILEARYQLTEKTALLGEVRFLRIVGDAADSPLVQDKNQPTLRLGIVRRLNFNF